jgi:hypothetical protein
MVVVPEKGKKSFVGPEPDKGAAIQPWKIPKISLKDRSGHVAQPWISVRSLQRILLMKETILMPLDMHYKILRVFFFGGGGFLHPLRA